MLIQNLFSLIRKSKYLKKLLGEDKSGMNLCACYSVYNGIELLEDSINSIKNDVDGIIISYQLVSNRGEENDEFLKWKEKHPHYKYIKYTPIVNLNQPTTQSLFEKGGTKWNERRKNQELIDTARDQGYPYCFFIHTDHLYESKEIKYAKEAILKNKYQVTYSKMKTYFKENYFCLDPLENYYMPFIFQTNMKLSLKVKTPVIVDPAFKFQNLSNYYIFSTNEVLMHHYSWLRYDIKNKLINAATRSSFKNIDKMIDEWENFKENDKFFLYPQHNIIKCKPIFKLKNYYKNK